MTLLLEYINNSICGCLSDYSTTRCLATEAWFCYFPFLWCSGFYAIKHLILFSFNISPWSMHPHFIHLLRFQLEPVIVDEKGVEIEGECSGYLCIKTSWPGAFRTLYGDHERYETTYFKPFAGYYFTGDGCSRFS